MGVAALKLLKYRALTPAEDLTHYQLQDKIKGSRSNPK